MVQKLQNLKTLLIQLMFTASPAAAARTRSCMHMKILKAWEADGRNQGAIYSDSAELLGNLFDGDIT